MTDEIPMVRVWKGTRIEELTREELIEAVEWLGDEYAESNSIDNVRARALGRVEMMKRGEL